MKLLLVIVEGQLYLAGILAIFVAELAHFSSAHESANAALPDTRPVHVSPSKGRPS